MRRFVACSHCLTPLTGSWSKGRSKRYPYYHCRKCSQVNTSKQQVETAFIDLLSQLQPDADYMRLFREIVLDVWKGRQVKAGATVKFKASPALKEAALTGLKKAKRKAAKPA